MRRLSLILLIFSFVAYPQTTETLTNEMIIKMVQSGVPTVTIISTITLANKVEFRFIGPDLQRLTDARVPNDVFKAMVARDKTGDRATANVSTSGAQEITATQAPPKVVIPEPARTNAAAGVAPQSGNGHYRQGEDLLKQGLITNAYAEFSRAAAIEPSSKKFAKKKSEIGAVLSDKALSEAETRLETDPNAADYYIRQSLQINPENSRAKQVSDTFSTRVATARTRLAEAQTAARNGEIDVATRLLGSLTVFRISHQSQEPLLSFEKADADLKSAQMALRLQQLWNDGKTDSVVDVLRGFESNPDGSYASSTVSEIRRAVEEKLKSQAQSTSISDVKGLIQRSKLLDMALTNDPKSVELHSLIDDSVAKLDALLLKSLGELKSVRRTSGGRLRLGVRDVANQLIGENAKALVGLNQGIDQAFPGLAFSVQVDDPRSCLPPNARSQIESEILKSLSPVARLVQSGGDLEARITNVSCSQIDIPRQSIQSVNSTYVAGQTQLANPLVVKNLGGLRMGVWIMPDNVAEGCLETFLRFLVPNKEEPIWSFAIESVQGAIKFGAECPEKDVSKANLYTWLAWQSIPGQQPGLALTKHILNPHSPYAEPFVKWFRALYEL